MFFFFQNHAYLLKYALLQFWMWEGYGSVISCLVFYSACQNADVLEETAAVGVPSRYQAAAAPGTSFRCITASEEKEDIAEQ